MLVSRMKIRPVERLVSGQEDEFSRVVILEAKGWAKMDEEFVVWTWRNYAMDIVELFDWEGEDARKAQMQARLADAIVEGQLIREVFLRQGRLPL